MSEREREYDDQDFYKKNNVQVIYQLKEYGIKLYLGIGQPSVARSLLRKYRLQIKYGYFRRLINIPDETLQIYREVTTQNIFRP